MERDRFEQTPQFALIGMGVLLVEEVFEPCAHIALGFVGID